MGQKQVVGTCLAEYCIQFLGIHICICQDAADIVSMKESIMVGRTADGVTNGEIVCREEHQAYKMSGLLIYPTSMRFQNAVSRVPVMKVEL